MPISFPPHKPFEAPAYPVRALIPANPSKVMSFQTFEGAATIELPANVSRESITLLIELLEMQKQTFPASKIGEVDNR